MSVRYVTDQDNFSAIWQLAGRLAVMADVMSDLECNKPMVDMLKATVATLEEKLLSILIEVDKDEQ